ncbi:Ribonuclease H-like superfamily [Sesbania bispinosa]|nr:Ribonuclease H-like superfamily [Sesbania bispinosa]
MPVGNIVSLLMQLDKRMKFHLAQIKNKDIVPCTEVPTDVRDHIQCILNTPKKPKTPKKQKADQSAAANGQQNSSSASGGFHHNHGSSGQNEDNLKHMFSHSEWLSSIYSRHPDEQAIKSLLYSDRFWKYAHEAVSISEPLVKFLRMVDGDMPAMGYIYEDLRMRNGFQEAMLRMATTDKDKMEITKELPIYINAQGALGTDFSVLGRTLNAPGDWWASYGYEIPSLQKAAVRILSQPCSSLWYKWNWSTFESIHNNKRNRVELEKLSDFVFVHCNLWLRAIFQRMEAKSRPIIYDEIDCSCEWPTEIESSPPLVDDSWLDDLPLQCRGSP